MDPLDKTGTKPVGDLAESWTISKEGLVYTFKLRHGVKFHDGSDMTSKDVKASYDKIIFPPAGVKSLRKDAYRSVEVVEAPDAHTVRFRLKYPESSFLLNLASPWNWIYKADILAKDHALVREERDGDRPLHLRRAREGLALGRQEEPQLLGQGQAVPRRLPGDVHELVVRAGGRDPG